MAEKKQSKIQSFFSKPSSVMNSLSNSLNPTSIVISSSDTPITQLTSSTTNINCTSTSYNIFDIAHYTNKLLTQSEIEEILTKIWVPNINYNFPIKILMVGKQKKVLKLKFQYKWLINFPWLAYSEVNNGAYCKYCVAFTKNEAGVNNQKLGAFVLKKYDDWKHALEDFKNHSNLEYHKKSLLDADNFLNMLKNPSRAIDKIIDNEKTKQILQNRKNIIPIIEAVILCGRQNLALRGHRDSGKIEINDSKVINDKSEGNFREIIRYRAQGDIEMKTYLESSGKMKYTSHRSQNDMIDACNNILLNKVVSRVNAAKCFSILADETADISGVEQVSLCVRYINSNTLKLTEEFLQFVPTNDMTGKGIANLILENLQKFGINTQYLRGQGYDGAAAMAGKFNGVQAHINEIHPNALYVHCSAHSLNLAVSKSCSVPAIRDCLGTISQIRDFFIYPKRKSVLIQKIENSSETSSKKTLKRSCETRWIERYHAVHDFLELFEYVEEALEDISEWNDNDTSEKARRLRFCMLNSEFIVCLFVLNKVFALGLILSKVLQQTSIDLKEAMSLAQNTRQELQEIRLNAEKEFGDIFERVKSLAEKIDIEINMPRISKRQTNRCNIQTDDPEIFYRVSVFIPYIDKFINELEERFTNHQSTLTNFHSLFKESGYEEDLISLTKQYSEDLEDVGNRDEVFKNEFKLWQRKLKSLLEIDKPKNAMEAIYICNEAMYPNIFKLLKILATLPVSSATNERTFSTLKRIKTYLRNSTSEVCLI